MKLSYSSLSTYELCPAKYRFQYEERLPTASSPALSFGDSLHRTLYRFHNRPVPVAPTLPEMLEMLDGEWQSDGFRDASEEGPGQPGVGPLHPPAGRSPLGRLR